MTEFADDSEFQKLLACRRDVDLIDAALELARDADPELDFRPTREWVKQRAAEIERQAASCHCDQTVLKRLVSHLANEHGLHGDEAAFSEPSFSYLPQVIETRRGLPISLSVLYMEIGRRAGIALQGIPAPMYFLSCFQALGGRVYVDAYANGRILSQTDCIHWLQSHTGLSARQIAPALRPATPRHIVTRMLNNLKNLHCRMENWPMALRVQQRITALYPADRGTTLDLGRLALQADVPGLARDAFWRCVADPLFTHSDQLQHLLREAERRIAQRN